MGMNLNAWVLLPQKCPSVCCLNIKTDLAFLTLRGEIEAQGSGTSPWEGPGVHRCSSCPASWGLWGELSAFQFPTSGAVKQEERNSSRVMPLSGQPISLNVHYKEKNKAASSLRSLVTPNYTPRRYGAFQKLVNVCLLSLTRIHLHQAGQLGHWATETQSTMAHSSVDPWCPLAKPGFSANRIIE